LISRRIESPVASAVTGRIVLHALDRQMRTIRQLVSVFLAVKSIAPPDMIRGTRTILAKSGIVCKKNGPATGSPARLSR
jgi:hypothetical protein